MNKRPSVYIGSSLEKLLLTLKGDNDKTSSIINNIADKYKILVEQYKPDLTRDEWLSLCAAYNGHLFRDGDEGMLGEIRSMEWQVSEWVKYNETEAAQFDTNNLCEKLESMGYAERISVLHYIKVFWTKGSNFSMFDEHIT